MIKQYGCRDSSKMKQKNWKNWADTNALESCSHCWSKAPIPWKPNMFDPPKSNHSIFSSLQLQFPPTSTSTPPKNYNLWKHNWPSHLPSPFHNLPFPSDGPSTVAKPHFPPWIPRLRTSTVVTRSDMGSTTKRSFLRSKGKSPKTGHETHKKTCRIILCVPGSSMWPVL